MILFKIESCKIFCAIYLYISYVCVIAARLAGSKHNDCVIVNRYFPHRFPSRLRWWMTLLVVLYRSTKLIGMWVGILREPKYGPHPGAMNATAFSRACLRWWRTRTPLPPTGSRGCSGTHLIMHVYALSAAPASALVATLSTLRDTPFRSLSLPKNIVAM